MIASDQPYLKESPRLVARNLLSRAQWAWTTYVISIGLYAFVFSQWQAQAVPDNVYTAGVVLAMLCLFPLAWWTAKGSKGTPAFELICIAYLLAFSSPLFLQKNQILILSQYSYFTWSETYNTVLIVIAGMLAMIFGYYLVHLSKIQLKAIQIDLPLHPQKRARFITLSFAFGFSLLALQATGINSSGGIFSSFINLIQNQIYVAIILLAYQVFRTQERGRWRIALYCAAGLASLLGLSIGMLEIACIPLVLLTIVKWNVSRKVPVAMIVGGLALFVVLNSVKANYRKQAWTQTSSLSVVDRIGLWVDLSQQAVGGNDSDSGGGDTIRKSMSRFDLLHQFVRVRQLTPSLIPFYQGSTYSYLIYGWVPRFLWPGKPIAQEANVVFAIDYGFMTKEQMSAVMIGIGHLPEAYANFGNLGVIVIMALQGMFFAVVSKILDSPRSEGGMAIYLSLMVFFLNGIGTGTASLFMLVIPTVIVNSLILRFFATGWQASPSSAVKASAR